MIAVINGDLFTTDADYICHQVNCRGVMGSGVAAYVREKYPKTFNSYKLLCDDHKDDRHSLLGKSQFCEEENVTIINMFGQNGFGMGKKQTSYSSFENCLKEIANTVPINKTIAMPYLIGCFRGGGDWNVVYPMIEKILGQKYTVFLYKYTENE